MQSTPNGYRVASGEPQDMPLRSSSYLNNQMQGAPPQYGNMRSQQKSFSYQQQQFDEQPGF